MSIQDFSVGVIGISMAVGPSVVAQPFYETNIWLSIVALLGITVLCLGAINGIIKLRRNLKHDKLHKQE